MEWLIIGGSLFLITGLSRQDRKTAVQSRMSSAGLNARKSGINEKAQRNRSRMNGEHIPYINIDTNRLVNHGRVALNTDQPLAFNNFVEKIDEFESDTQAIAYRIHDKWIQASNSILTGWGDRPSEIINTVDNN